MDRLQYLLIKLSEESTEVSKIALKTAQFGMDEKHPELSQTNKERIHSELNDLNAVVKLLNMEFDFNYEIDQQKVLEKFDKIDKYYNYSKQLGLVRDQVRREIMENKVTSLNEIMPIKHILYRDGVKIAESEDAKDIENAWRPAKAEHWLWERDGVTILESPSGTRSNLQPM